MSEGEFEGLLRRASTGDREAADELVRTCEGPLRMRIRHSIGRALRSRLETEDIFQSAVFEAVEDLPSLRRQDREAFLAWAARIAERKVIDHARRHRASRRDLGRERPIELAGGVTSGVTSPLEGAARTELIEGLREVVDRLPETERRVVELHSYQGMPFRAVAEELDLPDRHAARYLFDRALEAMGRHLRGGEGQR